MEDKEWVVESENYKVGFKYGLVWFSFDHLVFVYQLDN